MAANLVVGSWAGMHKASLLTAVLILLLLLACPTRARPTSRPSAPRPRPVYNVGAIFEVENITYHVREFQRAIGEINKQNDTLLEAKEIVLHPYRNVGDNFRYICDAIHSNNITAFFVMGSQNTINIVSIVTKYVGIPVIGYNSNKNTIAVRVSTVFVITRCTSIIRV